MRARKVLEILRRDGGQLALAESCTGGLAASRITAIPGSSDVFWGSTVVYSNKAKEELLGVSNRTLEAHGAVSPQVAREMVLGLQSRSGCSHCFSVTGVAGPGGGTEDKPVGLVWFSAVTPQGSGTWNRRFKGNRSQVQRKSVLELFEVVLRGLPVDAGIK